MTGEIDVEELKAYFHDLEKDFSFQAKNDPDFPPDMHALLNSLKRVNKLMKDSKNEQFFTDMIMVSSFMHALQQFEEDEFDDDDFDDDDLDDEDVFDDEDELFIEEEVEEEKPTPKQKPKPKPKKG